MAMATARTLRDRTRKKARHSLSGADDHAISTAEFRNSGHHTAKPPCTEYDAAYFQAYSHVGVHEEMIKDCVRTDAYRDAIFQHKDFIAGKVVVDVGCGTGILSIFCAQAGARRVYAVDASNIALQANEVVKANNFSDTVKVLHGRIEDVEIDDEVDVIVSEWMGYMLLYESMLGSVITARDRWLKPGGLILPSNATLYMAAVSHPDRYSGSVDFWRNVYGIDSQYSSSNPITTVCISYIRMSAMVSLAKQSAFGEPCVETISSENVLTLPRVVKHVDCYTVTMDELDSVTTEFRFNSMMRASLHGFAFWFDVKFGGPSQIPVPSDLGQTSKRLNPKEGLVLSTSPKDHPTHWQQTVVYTYEPTEVEEHEAIEGSVTLSQGIENRRFMNIHLEYTCGGRTLIKDSVLC